MDLERPSEGQKYLLLSLPIHNDTLCISRQGLSIRGDLKGIRMGMIETKLIFDIVGKRNETPGNNGECESKQFKDTREISRTWGKCDALLDLSKD